MWTFKTQCLGEIVISSRRFATRKEAWAAAIDWADIAYMNGEVVSVTILAVPQ
jgi:hypothetical protein